MVSSGWQESMADSCLYIRRSTTADLDRIEEIYGLARTFMRSHGNAVQWNGEYPSSTDAVADMYAGNGYVVTDAAGRVVGTFAFIVGYEPTYGNIDGVWLNDEPYGTIHRLASDGSVHGVADAVLEHCLWLIGNIRIDTHADNRPMIGWLESCGFSYCGVITVNDGTPRRAYQKISF